MASFKYFNLYLTNDKYQLPNEPDKLMQYNTSDNQTVNDTLTSYELYFYQRINRHIQMERRIPASTSSCPMFEDDQIFNSKALKYIIDNKNKFQYLIVTVTNVKKLMVENQLCIKVRIIDYMNGEWKAAQDDCFWFGHETRLAFDDIRYCNEFRKKNEIGIVSGIIGPMFAGKTTKLINRVKKLEEEGVNVIVVTIKSDQNDKYDDSPYIITHDKKLKYDTNVIAVKYLWNLEEVMETVDNLTLAIEELHLYPDSQYFVSFAQVLGINVILCLSWMLQNDKI